MEQEQRPKHEHRKPQSLMFDTNAKNISWRKRSIVNKWCWENWMSKCRRMRLGRRLSPYTKTNSKQVKDMWNLNTRQAPCVWVTPKFYRSDDFLLLSGGVHGHCSVIRLRGKLKAGLIISFPEW